MLTIKRCGVIIYERSREGVKNTIKILKKTLKNMLTKKNVNGIIYWHSRKVQNRFLKTRQN